MRILALDIGDRWIGIALSDPLGILARPYKTIEKKDLDSFIEHYTAQEGISHIIVGYPQTLQGKESHQTRSVLNIFHDLKIKFPHLVWILSDERFSSKHANQLKKAPAEKEHARAAAFILSIYLNKPKL